jgi:hypothetical protein
MPPGYRELIELMATTARSGRSGRSGQFLPVIRAAGD